MSVLHAKARKPAPRRPSFGRQLTLPPRVRPSDILEPRASTPARSLGLDEWAVLLVAWLFAIWSI